MVLLKCQKVAQLPTLSKYTLYETYIRISLEFESYSIIIQMLICKRLSNKMLVIFSTKYVTLKMTISLKKVAMPFQTTISLKCGGNCVVDNYQD